MNLENKVILLTGASSGIGRNLAVQLAEKNCSLALVARREELLNNLKKEIAGKVSGVEIYVCDVTDKDKVNTVVQDVINKFGRVDVAILNAGVGVKSGINDFDTEKAKEVFETNVIGIINFINALLPDLLKRKAGIIAGVSSLADARGFPGSGFYCASKAAATIFLESLRVELKSYNIKVITVKPGYVRTPMTDKNKFPMPFIINADKAAKIIIKGIEKEKRIIQFPLPTVLITKLLQILPDPLFDFIMQKEPPGKKK
ncbi:fatty acyl-CoA reductase [bacterium BMS3Abin03]|nr:fatty acyl-CoA reductase [bacterium BMS3Abin03]